MTGKLKKTKHCACRFMGLFLAMLMLLFSCSWLAAAEALQTLNGAPTLMERLQVNDQAARFQLHVPTTPDPDRKAAQNYWDWFVGTGCDGLDAITPSPKSSGLESPATYLETVWAQAAPRPVEYYLTRAYHDFGHLKVMPTVEIVKIVGRPFNISSRSPEIIPAIGFVF